MADVDFHRVALHGVINLVDDALPRSFDSESMEDFDHMIARCFTPIHAGGPHDGQEIGTVKVKGERKSVPLFARSRSQEHA